jgi:hypothetical protein
MRCAAAVAAVLAIAFPCIAQTGSGQTGSGQTGSGQTGSAWVPGRTAELQALDKVTARIVVLEAPVEREVRFGTLVIRVGACHRRPPDDPPDAAAWLEVRDTRPGAAPLPFRGWMFAASPGLSMLEHPVYDLRVLACR